MIFGQMSHRDSYKDLEPAIQACFDYAKAKDLVNWDKGSYDIDGRDVFVNIVGYETGDAQDKGWEAHREYLDIHLMLKGEEIILLNDIDKMEQGVFEPQGDYLPLEGEATVSVTCKPMDFLICYPEDGHKPGVKAADAPMTIKKAIFKVKIK